MQVSRALIAAGLLSLGASAQAFGLAAFNFDFDSDAQGWTTIDGGAQAWKASGGNGGGYLEVTDVSDADFLLVAPTILSNWSGLLGATIYFDAKNINSESPSWPEFGQIRLTGPAGTALLDIAADNQPPADGQWHRYSALLSPAAGWTGASLVTVLADVQSFTVKGEFHAGVTEVVGIDNIGVGPVPEPASFGLMGAGLLLLAARRRR